VLAPVATGKLAVPGGRQRAGTETGSRGRIADGKTGSAAQTEPGRAKNRKQETQQPTYGRQDVGPVAGEEAESVGPEEGRKGPKRVAKSSGKNEAEHHAMGEGQNRAGEGQTKE
jgi:hypothetical protein